MADRDAWYGDVGDALPLQALLSTSYADERRCLIRDAASQRIEPGSPGGLKPAPVPLIGRGSQARLPSRGEGEPTVGRQSHPADIPETAMLGDTCHVDAVDRWGNLVAATPSGGWLQSSPAIPGLPIRAHHCARRCSWLTEGMNSSSLMPGRRPWHNLNTHACVPRWQPVSGLRHTGRRPARPMVASHVNLPPAARYEPARGDRHACIPYGSSCCFFLAARDRSGFSDYRRALP